MMINTKPAGWVDCHVHIDELNDFEKEIEKAEACGVVALLAVAQYKSSWSKILEISKAHQHCNSSSNGLTVYAGLGLHPAPDGEEMSFVSYDDVSAPNHSLQEAIQEIRRIHHDTADSNKDKNQTTRAVNAIGEIGLDWKWANTAELRTKQRRLLDEQLSLAAELQLPVSLHSRRAAREVLEAAAGFHRSTGLGAALHWFSHSAKLIKQATAQGVYVSIGPSAIYDESDRMQIVKGITHDSLDRILLETDGPVVFANEPAVPSWIPRVGSSLSDLIKCPVDEIQRRTTQNFFRYMGLST